MRDTDTAWLAGIVDGEGCLSLPRIGRGEAYKAMLFIDNSSLAMIEKAERIIRELGGSPGRQTSRPGGMGTLMVHRLYLYRDIGVVLRALIPYLVTEKRDFALAILDLQSMRTKAYCHWTEEQRTVARDIRARFMRRASQL